MAVCKHVNDAGEEPEAADCWCIDCAGRQSNIPALDRGFPGLSAPFRATKILGTSDLCPPTTTFGNRYTTCGNLDNLNAALRCEFVSRLRSLPGRKVYCDGRDGLGKSIKIANKSRRNGSAGWKSVANRRYSRLPVDCQSALR